MIIAGLQKVSLIDYPGKVSCVVFLSGCNFDCPYCHNRDLVRCGAPIALLDKTEVYGFLQKRREILDGVVISGGEPTLQKDLFSLCDKIKQFGYPIKLDTNGSRPEVIERLIHEGFVDYIAMDIKTDPFHYSPYIVRDYDPSDILSSIQVIMESGILYEFRTTCVRPIVCEAAIERIAETIKDARRYALQRFRNRGVLHPEFFDETVASYTEEELRQLKSIAGKWVKKCVVR